MRSVTGGRSAALTRALEAAHFLVCAWVLAVFACLSLAACGTTSGDPPVPRFVEQEGAVYRIGPLDTLNIVVWRNPDLSTTLTVRPDGFISVPLVDQDILASGRTAVELARAVQDQLGSVVREPIVSVFVAGAQGVLSEQVRVVGEVARPTAFAHRTHMTLLDAVILAGGLAKSADGNRSVLVRGVEGGKRYSVRLGDLLEGGDLSANAEVLPGDIVIVPQRWF